MKPLLLTAVHVQLVPLAVITTLRNSPAALKLALVEVGVTLQAAAPSVTAAMFALATVMVPDWPRVLV